MENGTRQDLEQLFTEITFTETDNAMNIDIQTKKSTVIKALDWLNEQTAWNMLSTCANHEHGISKVTIACSILIKEAPDAKGIATLFLMRLTTSISSLCTAHALYEEGDVVEVQEVLEELPTFDELTKAHDNLHDQMFIVDYIFTRIIPAMIGGSDKTPEGVSVMKFDLHEN